MQIDIHFDREGLTQAVGRTNADDARALAALNRNLRHAHQTLYEVLRRHYPVVMDYTRFNLEVAFGVSTIADIVRAHDVDSWRIDFIMEFGHVAGMPALPRHYCPRDHALVELEGCINFPGLRQRDPQTASGARRAIRREYVEVPESTREAFSFSGLGERPIHRLGREIRDAGSFLTHGFMSGGFVPSVATGADDAERASVTRSEQWDSVFRSIDPDHDVEPKHVEPPGLPELPSFRKLWRGKKP